MRCYKSRDSSGPRRPDPSATASRRAGGTAERAAAGFSLDVTTSLDSDLRTPHYIIRSFILRTISPDHLPSRFRRGTSLGLGSPHIAAAPASDRAAHLGQHLPRTARPRASSLARAESGRARGAPDARGGPTAAHDIKGTPTIFPSYFPPTGPSARTHTVLWGGATGATGLVHVWWFGPILYCGAVVKSSLYINNRQPYGSLST